LSCGEARRTETVAEYETVSDVTMECLDVADAEKILGQRAELKETSSGRKAGALRYECSFTAMTPDPKTNAVGNLYYMLIRFDSEQAAKKDFSDLVASNAQQAGQSKLNDIGDEAWFHSDGQNFNLIVVRKGANELRLKINKITSFTSEDRLKSVAKELAQKM
jgi:hypothetical protein